MIIYKWYVLNSIYGTDREFRSFFVLKNGNLLPLSHYTAILKTMK